MRRDRIVPRLVFPWLLSATLLSLVPPAAASDDDAAWRVLSEVRSSLTEAGPIRAEFSQTFIPAGFSTGDVESGTLAIHLPDCLRWDYAEPYPKAFLLCGETAHLWNPEDATGRRYTVDRDREPGLDLVLLGIDQLEERYRVSREEDTDGRVTVHLIPKEATGSITEATMTVDSRTDRLSQLSYTDDEGNVTRFEIGGYEPLAEDGTFSPPGGIEWTEEEP